MPGRCPAFLSRSCIWCGVYKATCWAEHAGTDDSRHFPHPVASQCCACAWQLTLVPDLTGTGTIALSRGLADSLEALFNARIPADWLAKSWEAATLGSWFTGLLQRHDQLARWLATGRPKSYWLTGFFNPQVPAAPMCCTCGCRLHRASLLP